MRKPELTRILIGLAVVAVVITAGIALYLTTALPKEKTASLANYRIAFVSTRDGNPDIYVMDSDGQHQRRLTDHPIADLYPVWSPDGRQIAFLRINESLAFGRMTLSTADNGLYLISADGSGEVRLTPPEMTTFALVPPAWSLDGTCLAFVVSRRAIGDETAIMRLDNTVDDVYLVAPDGGDLTRIVKGALVNQLAWSPDGQHFLFCSSERKLYLVSRDGGEPKSLYEDSRPRYVTWSPTGQEIAFYSDQDGLIYRAPLETGEKVAITHSPLFLSALTWSPDGGQLAFVTAGGPGEPRELYVVPAAGGDPVRLNAVDGWLSWPAWSPDGHWLLLTVVELTAGGRISPSALYAVEVAADRAIRLTGKDDFDGMGAWAP
ncbi:MAG: PD40 domain-containing protein [Anaerolineae bacterium]|nr:PD40 domain-containing protein [Anaerolineae bacterium]